MFSNPKIIIKIILFAITFLSIRVSHFWLLRGCRGPTVTQHIGKLHSSISPHTFWLNNLWTTLPLKRPDSIQRLCWGETSHFFSQFSGAGRFGSRVLLTPATSAPPKPQQNRAALSEFCWPEMKACYWWDSFCGPEWLFLGQLGHLEKRVING